MSWKKYNCRFYSENTVDGEPDVWYQIAIYQETGSGTEVDFKCTSNAFTLKMDGGDDPLTSSIKTTSLEFDMIIEGPDQEQIIDDILSVSTGNENEYSVKVSIYIPGTGWSTLWRGVLLGDLVQVQDVGLNNIIKVQAIDGLGQLKYKLWDSASYGGIRSCMYIIKACLRNIPLISNVYGTGDNFIAHIPFYYNKAMAGGLTGANGVDSDTWRENVSHDPFSLTCVNTEVFKNDDGSYWSYYDILEQILGAFQSRLMMNMVNDGSSPKAMWFIQNPFVYHDWNNNLDTDNLIFFHGNDLGTDDALSYINNFSTKLTDPSTRLSGGLTTFTPPLLSYKSVYNHKIMQNLALGPVSFNSQEYSEANPSTTADLIVDTPTNAFSYRIVKDQDETDVPGNGGFHKPSMTKVLITGELEYYPYHWAAWDFFNQNNYTINFGAYTNGIGVDQYVAARMGLMVSSRSEFNYSGTDYLVYNFYYLGSSRFGNLTGSVPWVGPGETSVGSPYIGFWNTTYPSEFTYDDFDTGDDVYPWGTDTNEWLYWFNNGASISTSNHWGFFTPYVHYVNSYLIAEGSAYSDFQDAWSFFNYSNLLGTGVQAFSVESPAVPVVGNQYGFTPDTGVINHIDLIYAFGRDMWDNDGTGNYYTCCLDWTNWKELLHEDRGVGFGYNLNNVRVYILGNENIDDGYYDYSIGEFTNGNGTPSDSDTQDPEIIIGDEPAYHGNAVEETNEGINPVYFGQFWIRNTNPATSTNDPFYLGVDTTRWICKWESDDAGNWLKLHEKRCKMEVGHRYKLGQKLDVSFIDKSPETTYTGDFLMTHLAFSGIYLWSSGSTEQSNWIDKPFMIAGGEFNAGTMEWKVQLMECNNFYWSNLTNTSYSNNNNS